MSGGVCASPWTHLPSPVPSGGPRPTAGSRHPVSQVGSHPAAVFDELSAQYAKQHTLPKAERGRQAAWQPESPRSLHTVTAWNTDQALRTVCLSSDLFYLRTPHHLHCPIISRSDWGPCCSLAATWVGCRALPNQDLLVGVEFPRHGPGNHRNSPRERERASPDLAPAWQSSSVTPCRAPRPCSGPSTMLSDSRNGTLPLKPSRTCFRKTQRTTKRKMHEAATHRVAGGY